MVYQLPSSFSGGMQGAVDSLRAGTLPKPINSPVVKPSRVREAKLPTRQQKPQPAQSNIVPLEEKKRRVIKMEEQGATQEEIQLYLDSLKKGEQSQPAQNPNANKLGNKMMELVQGGITGATRGIGDIASFVENTPTIGEMIFGKRETNLPSIAQPINRVTEGLASGLEDINQNTSTQSLNPNSKTSKVGQFVGQVALSNAILPGVSKASTIFPKIASGGTQGLVNAGTFGAVNKGYTTPGELIAGTTAGILAPVVATGLSKSGKALYKTAIKPNTQEAEQIINATARKAKLPTTRADTALNYGVVGTQKRIGVTGVREADKIFKDTIAPALERSKAQHNIDDIFAKVESKIAGEKSALRKQELMEGFSALKEDFVTTGKKVFSSLDLQNEKSALDQFTPAKIFKGKDVAQGYNQVKNTLANVMREQVRDDLSEAGVKNAQQLYKDYSNLVMLRDIGVKGLTEGGLKGGFGTFWSTIYDTLATPIKTVGGKYLYKLGNGIEFVGPKGIVNFAQFLGNEGLKVKDGELTK